MNVRQQDAPPDGMGHLKTSQNHRKDEGPALAIAAGSNSHRDGCKYITPKLDKLPPELTQHGRWLLWRGKKVPYRASAPKQTASSTDPSSWSSFEAAKDAYDPSRDGGIGFALGDGFACVDIDHCSADNEAALFLLETTGCGYIEVSPSGDGLHGWALSHDRLARCKGTLDGLSVEVYNAGRYMTVTGRSLAHQPIVFTDGILRLSMALQREERPANFTDVNRCQQMSTEVNRASYISPPLSEIPEKFLPTKTGERNKQLFKWARHMKTINPDADKQQRIKYAVQWFNAAEPIIGTKEVAVTIDDFLRAWRDCSPETFGMHAAVESAKCVPVPDHIAAVLGEHLLAYQLCVALQRERGNRPFFLTTRTLGKHLHTSHTVAAGCLRILRALGVLVVAEEHTRTKSTRFYVAPEYLKN